MFLYDVRCDDVVCMCGCVVVSCLYIFLMTLTYSRFSTLGVIRELWVLSCGCGLGVCRMLVV